MGKFDKKSVAARTGAKAAPRPVQREVSADVSSNPELTKITSWLSGVKFLKKTIGGVDPVDVWKKIEELNAMYEKAIIAERVRYDLLLQQARQDGYSNNLSPERDGDG